MKINVPLRSKPRTLPAVVSTTATSFEATIGELATALPAFGNLPARTPTGSAADAVAAAVHSIVLLIKVRREILSLLIGESSPLRLTPAFPGTARF